ncbi:MAG TPA: hypothetical protein VMJ10_32675, partial [Kofleriaceae bacterium]|nr:hypothetical protein [Kofleriaceae bacterium]
MAETTEPRALTAALAAPTFVTRNAGAAMHAATRHVERWAPEVGASRVRPLRNLGFVDRLVAPWLQAAERWATSPLFAVTERESARVSWVFPRPWYQDELEWMAAAREAGESAAEIPTMLTTRATYVPTARAAAAMPPALYELVAPSLSVTRTDRASAASAEAYSPLVPFAAARAAQAMARIVAPLSPAGVEAPRANTALRAMLGTLLARAATATPQEIAPTRLAALAPELVTPPAPSAPELGAARDADADAPNVITPEHEQVLHAAGAQRAQLAELQRAVRVIAERELAARARATASSEAAPPASPAPAERAVASGEVVAERARIEARVAERLAEREAEQREVVEEQRAIEQQRAAAQ